MQTFGLNVSIFTRFSPKVCNGAEIKRIPAEHYRSTGLHAFFAVLLGGHAGNTLEIAVKGGWLGETEHIGRFLKRLCGACLNEAFGLGCHVLLYPFGWRDIGSQT